ncbi:MAG TPA: hypothetical protein PLX06_15525, partial [Fimbriimonadaceae bacterium]|nr:hypothetical protein [Fimbriimonadaceae bacterium]
NVHRLRVGRPHRGQRLQHSAVPSAVVACAELLFTPTPMLKPEGAGAAVSFTSIGLTATSRFGGINGGRF